jgi:hypothetical protein
MALPLQSGGSAVGKQLNLGYPGNVAATTGAGDIVTDRAVQASDTSPIPFGAPAVLNPNNTYSLLGSTVTSLTSALAASTTYTSLSVAPLTGPILAGSQILIGGTAQTVTASATLEVGATTIPVVSFTANAAYAVGTSVQSTNVFAQFAGIACREVQQSTTYFPATGGTYLPGTLCDVIQFGSVTVACNYGTPIAGGPVYIRTVLNPTGVPNGVVSGFEAAADPTNSAYSFLVSNAQWQTGYLDANGNGVITLLSRNRP